MKILKLTFENLNSLYGKWVIDFEDDAYDREGLFLLTGPTGAGKSTVLDAICLALYGETPRINTFNKLACPVMSHGTKRCSAEVVFSTVDGTRYYASWEQRHGTTRGQALQVPTCEFGTISPDGGTKQPLTDKMREKATLLQATIHMTAEQFTRSVMLAQGSFDKFLKATAEEKGGILEQITSTAQYGAITAAVYERKKQEAATLERLQDELGASPISEEELAARAQAVATVSAEVTQLKTAFDGFNARYTWRRDYDKTLAEQTQLTAAKQTNDAALEAFAPDRQRLDAGLRAKAIEPLMCVIKSKLKSYKETEANTNACQEEVTATAAALTEATTAATTAETEFQHASDALASQSQALTELIALDDKIAQQAKTLDEKQAAHKKLVDDEKTSKKDAAKAKNKATSLEEARKRADDALQKHAADAALGPKLEALELKYDQLCEAQTALEAAQQKVQTSTEAISPYEKKVEAASKRETKAKNEETEAKDAVAAMEAKIAKLLDGDTLATLRTLATSQSEYALLVAKIKTLDDAHKALRPGTACPLCGHRIAKSDLAPNAEKIASEHSALTKRIQTIEALQAKLVAAQSTLNEATLAVQHETNAVGTAQNALQYAKKEITAAEEQVTKATTAVEKHHKALQKELMPFVSAKALKGDLQEVLAELSKRYTAYQTLDDDLTTAEHNLTSNAATLATAQEHLKNVSEQKASAAEAEAAAQEALTQLQQTRTEASEEPDPRGRLAALQSAVEATRKVRDDKKEARSEATTAHETKKAQLETYKDNLKSLKKELNDAKSEGRAKLQENNFKDVTAFAEARLKDDLLKALQARATAVDDEAKRIAGQFESVTKALETLHSSPQCDLETSLASLEDARTTAQSALDEKNRDLGAAKQLLLDGQQLSERAKALAEKIGAQQAIVTKWTRLCELIGPEKGNNTFANFVHGITLDLLVASANDFLTQLMPRYQLSRASEGLLELEICDRDQGDITRTIKNLSGGECFIISLALALGLSKLNRGNIHIETLFLDEGFGTLDEATLNQALDALTRLRQEGTHVGIISHVELLSQAIPVQILVQPQSAGHSLISGPGIQRLS